MLLLLYDINIDISTAPEFPYVFGDPNLSKNKLTYLKFQHADECDPNQRKTKSVLTLRSFSIVLGLSLLHILE